MMEKIEIRNEGDVSLWAAACRSKLTHKLFVHVCYTKSDIDHKQIKIPPKDYRLVNIRNVEG